MSEHRSRRAAREARSSGAPADGAAHNPTPRAGRNLYAAIGVGVLLGAVVILSLFLRKEVFVAVAMAASVIGCVEMLRALSHGDLHPPAIPTLATAAVVPLVAYVWGAPALAFSAIVAVLACVVWRSTGRSEDMLRDMAGAALVILYVPALVGFAMLLLASTTAPSASSSSSWSPSAATSAATSSV